MKRSQTITLLALGLSLTACSNHNNTNYCDRSNSDYDQQKCDQQLQDKQHSYFHGGYVYYPWFRNNFNNNYTSRLSYGWNKNSTTFSPVRTSSLSPVSESKVGTSSVTRGGFGSMGAHAASGGGE